MDRKSGGRMATIGRTTGLLVLALAATAAAQSADAHGIAGNRLFPGTLGFDDPAVADEFAVQSAVNPKRQAEGAEVRDTATNWSFMRLLTPDLAAGINSGYIHRGRDGFPSSSGFDQTSLTLKRQLYKDEAHETLVAASLTWGIGRSGAQGVGASNPDTIVPGITFGRGFGDLPDSMSWLRPFGIAGAASLEIPLARTSTGLGVDPDTGIFGQVVTRNVETLHWGFALEFSTLYLTKRFTGGPPKEEPLNQLVPLVEFAFESPRGEKTKANMNPGFAYVAQTWQVAVEAIVPLNSEAGRGVGARAQLLLFLDDLAPSLFGKPLLSR
jgi:hypothetical protein